MFADFFIKRPVFASVCSFIILLTGAIALPTLPVAQYPDISPTQVQVSATYNGADAEVVENTVTTILERQINGVEGLRYLQSTSSNNGTSTITATFDASRNKDIAAVDVQNRISVVEAQLPQSVQQTGVSITKVNGPPILGVGLFSQNREYDNIFLSNYADLYLVDALKRVPGVSDIQIFGERRYSMRIWLDPARLAGRNLTAQDVVDALNEQNLQVGAGQIGQPPSIPGQMYQIDLRAVGRLKEPKEFEEIILKASSDGTLVKLQDVGRAELGAESYSSFLRFSGQEAVGLGVQQIPGSNALEVVTGVKAELERLSAKFPPGMTYKFGYDPILFVQESRKEVVQTLIEAIVLVIIVIFVFLQDWRTTLIPAITIPISLIGTFAFMQVFGFSINSLTLFGLTLATGLVVDDAIVVIENIERLIQDEKMPPRQAATAAMAEVTGAVIATSLVLMAVFVPVAFFPGTTGQLYKQFALTIAFSIAISAFNALTLTPALSAILLRQAEARRQNWLFRRINWVIDKTRNGYKSSLHRLTRFKAVVLVLFVASLVVTGWLYLSVPSAFLPDEDQGYFITLVQGPEGSSINYTSQVMRQVEKELLQGPETLATFAVGGYSFSGSTANNGVIFTTLKPWSERRKASQSAAAIVNKLREPFAGITEARVVPISPPAIQGLGSYGGFLFELQDQGNNGLDSLVQIRDKLVQQANQTPNLSAVFSNYAANTPQLLIEVDRNKAKALQVSVEDIFNTLQTLLGSRYVNDFNLFQRSYRVYVQAAPQFRANPRDIGLLYIRSQTGQMIPLNNLVQVSPTTGAQTINHYNLFRSIEINGSPAAGASSGQAIQAMEKLAATILPTTMGYEWSGISLEEIQSGGKAPLIFGLGIVFVFLVLAAQYENYVDPLIIMLAVPLAIMGALLAQSWRGFANDVYCQIGLVMLIGLASKNAILIVEFANQMRARGLPITKAAIEAAQERLRPILMTAIAFILGIFPLVIASGAGAVSRQSLGTAVFGGMIVSTFLSLFVVPILYIVIETVRHRLQRGRHKSKDQQFELSTTEEVKTPSQSR